MVFGFLGSVISARTGLVEPCITTRASSAVAEPVHDAPTAAQVGTVTGLGSGAGLLDGLGLGDGLGLELGLNVGLGLERLGLAWDEDDEPAPQPDTAIRTHASTKPLLTGVLNEPDSGVVTQVL